MTLAKLYLLVLLMAIKYGGGVAQMVERSLSMREVPGSIPGASKKILARPTHQTVKLHFLEVGLAGPLPVSGCPMMVTKNIASSGNRTRAARVAGEHSTTEPTMLF